MINLPTDQRALAAENAMGFVGLKFHMKSSGSVPVFWNLQRLLSYLTYCVGGLHPCRVNE